MNRSEHLQWCKDRALDYCQNGDSKQGIISFMSDMSKHIETENHKALEMIMPMMVSGMLSTNNDVTNFIIGFN